MSLIFPSIFFQDVGEISQRVYSYLSNILVIMTFRPQFGLIMFKILTHIFDIHQNLRYFDQNVQNCDQHFRAFDLDF